MIQTKNRTLESHQKLYLTLQKSAKIIREKFNSHFVKSEMNITYDQWLILQQIHLNRNINQKTIAYNLGKEVAVVSRIMKKLLDKNLVLRKPNHHNFREIIVRPTDQGYLLISKIESFERKALKDLFTDIYEQEFNLVLNVLQRINR